MGNALCHFGISKRKVDFCIEKEDVDVSPQLQLDIEKHNSQYFPIKLEVFANSHDRFLCIDDTVYHIGASLKDLGKKWFAFSKMEIDTESLIGKIF